MIYAVIDVGSNTIRLSVYKCENGLVKTLFSNKETVGLAGYIKDTAITRAGIDKACYTLNTFKSTLSNFDIDGGIHAFATASLRNVSNTAQAVEAIRLSTGIVIDVISGKEEARLDYVGAGYCAEMMNVTDGMLIDIGGGSTEIVAFKGKKVIVAESLPLGSLNSYKQFCSSMIPTGKEQEEIKSAVTKELRRFDELKKHKHSFICGVGGTVRAVKKINNEVFDLLPSNNRIRCDDLRKIAKELSAPSGVDLILRIAPDRLRTIVSGTVILRTIVDYFGGEEIVISDLGVREGYLYSKILGE